MNNQSEHILGQENIKTDKLGNTQLEQPKDGDNTPMTRREQRKANLGLAASPPDRRRGRDVGASSDGWGATMASPAQVAEPGNEVSHAKSDSTYRRQYDRHSGTGIRDTSKKIQRGWGDPVASQVQAASDSPRPQDPAGREKQTEGSYETADDSRYMTLDEYRAAQGK